MRSDFTARKRTMTARIGRINRMASVTYEKNPVGSPEIPSFIFVQIPFSQSMARPSFR
jgi:hypothetical protein